MPSDPTPPTPNPTPAGKPRRRPAPGLGGNWLLMVIVLLLILLFWWGATVNSSNTLEWGDFVTLVSHTRRLQIHEKGRFCR